MMMRVLTLMASATLLTACEGGGDPVEQALREEAANNHAEAEFARQQQATVRAAAEAEHQTRLDRLDRDIAVAQAALNAAPDPATRAAAQASLDQARADRTALAAGR